MRIENARVSAHALPRGEGDWSAALADANGIIDPDLVAKALLSALHNAIDAIGGGKLQAIALSGVEIVLPGEDGPGRTIAIDSASLHVERPGELSVAIEARVAGHAVSVAGMARQDGASRRISGFDLTVEARRGAEGGDAAVSNAAERGTGFGRLELRISGEEGAAEEASRFAIAASVTDSVLRIDDQDSIAGDASVAATLVTGSGKVEIDRARLTVGRSRFVFHGAVGSEAACRRRTGRLPVRTRQRRFLPRAGRFHGTGAGVPLQDRRQLRPRVTASFHGGTA